MFLDDELEAIYTEHGFNPETSVRLLKACIARIRKIEDCPRPEDFLNDIKRIENGWKLFCKRHPQYRPEGFRDLMMKQCGDILSKPVLEYLHWN